jgi:prephenate dehydrogenase
MGVGLIGGSVGLALRRRNLAERVVGIGRNAASLRRAQRRGAVTSTTTRLAQGVAESELVVVCTPVESIVEHVRAVASACRPGTLITDAGSTKGRIVSSLDGAFGRDVTFVGSHPLAGSEKKGADFASDRLFEGRIVVITPTRQTRKESVQAIERFWQSLGARVVRMSPQAHDEAVAATSHLPHLAASALVAATPEAQLPLAATGWLDSTRVAAGDVELWTQILGENRDSVLAALERYEKNLAAFRTALTRNDRRRLAALLKSGKERRDAVGD